MLERIYGGLTFTLLNKSLDGANLSNQVMAVNIANVNTPGFKRKEVLFQEKLREATQDVRPYSDLMVTNNRHIQIKENKDKLTSFQPEVRQLDDFNFRNDENNVDIDVEMANLTKNKIYYDSVSQSLSNEIRLLRMAITGRS